MLRQFCRTGCQVGIVSLTISMLMACQPTPTPTARPPLTRADFDFVTLNISFAEVEEQVGPPDQIVGSGLRTPVYKLADGSLVLIRLGASEMVKGASLVESNGDVEVLIPYDHPEGSEP